MPVLSTYPLSIGGAELYSYNLALNLSKLHHNVLVFAPSANSISLNDLNIANNFKIKFFPYVKMKFVSGLIYAVGLLLKTLKTIPKLRRIDLIHAHTAIYPMIGSYIVSRLLKIPLIISCHGSDIRINRKSMVLKHIQNFIFRRIKRVVVVSNELKMILKKDLKNISVETIPAGVDKEFFKSKPRNWGNKGIFKLLFVGNLRKIKNPILILRALNKLKNYKFNLELTMIGFGPLYNELREFCEIHNLTNVIFIKQVIPKNLRDYYQKADLFILPSLGEGTPLTLLEAMASGLPIIASNVGGISDLIKNNHNGILIEPNNTDLLVDKIKYLIENQDISKKIGENAQKTIHLKSWETVCRKYLAIYHSIQK